MCTEAREVVAGKDEQQHKGEDGREFKGAIAEPAAEEGDSESTECKREDELEDEQRRDPAARRRLVATEHNDGEEEVGQREMNDPNGIGGRSYNDDEEGEPD